MDGEVGEITAFRYIGVTSFRIKLCFQYRLHFLLAAVNAERQLLVPVSACDRRTHRQLTCILSCPSNVRPPTVIIWCQVCHDFIEIACRAAAVCG